MCMNSFLLEENAGAWSHGAQMSLRSQLEELLPELLPSDPAQAIKGTELIRLVRLRLGEEYSDASLRYHFSFMASDPDSEIAKVERGQGYYRRQRDRGGKSAAQRASAPVSGGRRIRRAELPRQGSGAGRAAIRYHGARGLRFQHQ